MMHSRVVDLGIPVHYADFGGAGPAMVLVHGLGGSHANWLAVGPGLAGRARVVAPDLAGFGLTRAPRRAASRIAANRELLDRFLEQVIGGPAILVGNSMGGLISLLEAATVPARVAGLVLVAPALPWPRGTHLDPAVRLAFAMFVIPGLGAWLLRRRAERLGPAGLVAEVLRLCCVDPARVPADVVRAHVELAARRMRSMPEANEALIVAARSMMLELRHRERFASLVARVTAPTLLIHGTGDRLVPIAACQDLADARPDWRFQVFEYTGHVPQLETPARFVDALAGWLDDPGVRAAADARRLA
jgi:pimeloyl-ACP methyl ester carboxylesterase